MTVAEPKATSGESAVPRPLPHIPAPGGAVELHRGASSVRVAVGFGAPITSFVTQGHEWCAGGPWQDYAPTSGACSLPTFVAGGAGAAFPEGGLLAAEEPTVDVQADGSSGTITTWWPPSPYPLGWTRIVSLDSEGALCVRYVVTNAQRTPLPFIWGMPAPIPSASPVVIDLPRGARSRVAAAYGEGLPAPGSEFAWPALRDGGRLIDLSEPARFGPRRAVLCYVELARGRVVLRAGDAALEISGSHGVVTHARVWINNDGDTPGAAARNWWRRRAAAHAVSVGLAVGAPALLSDAVGSWGAARWVNPGESIQWDVRYRSIPPPA